MLIVARRRSGGIASWAYHGRCFALPCSTHGRIPPVQTREVNHGEGDEDPQDDRGAQARRGPSDPCGHLLLRLLLLHEGALTIPASSEGSGVRVPPSRHPTL